MINEEYNEEYNEVETKYYNYKAKENLSLYFDDIKSFNNVYLCSYNVNKTSLYPFLQFLFVKSKTTNILQFPELQIFKNFDESELISYSKTFLFSLCMLNDFQKFNESIIFDGFYKYENNLYLFFDITDCEKNITNTYSNSPVWFAIVDEIVNHKKICNLPIEENLIHLFTSNDDFCFLVDENNNSYEIPVVGFIGTSNDLLKFKYAFGESSQNKNAILGPYFYFTNFINAFTSKNVLLGHDISHDISDDISESIKINDCLIRFALFTGKVKYIENNIDDPIDDSEIKQQRLQDSTIDQNIERLTMRISDHDGLWSRDFDSAYLGKIELDNGEYLQNTPMFVIKYYEQQCPLTYHYVNKKIFNGESENYRIL
jgi:hypothetical protein